MLKYITPLTIGPSVAMIGISLFKSASGTASTNWPISMATAGIMILFSQYIKDVPLPVPSFTKGKTGSNVKKIYIFRLFPVLLTILVMWLVCVVLTMTDVLPEGDFARADANLDLIKKVKWFRIPYPCKCATMKIYKVRIR